MNQPSVTAVSLLLPLGARGKSYSNEIVGECFECSGDGVVLAEDEIVECISCDGLGTIYYGEININ